MQEIWNAYARNMHIYQLVYLARGAGTCRILGVGQDLDKVTIDYTEWKRKTDI